MINSKALQERRILNDSNEKGRVVFIGAGPGDPELLTLKACRIIKKADVIIYAGSLVNPEVLAAHKADVEIFNSASMNLTEIIEVMVEATNQGLLVARVHTGDPSIYGAIAEQIQELKKKNIDFKIVPGVSSLFAAAAAVEAELTRPEVSQTVIITRPSGRTPKPESESIVNLAEHGATMCIFLGIQMIDKVVGQLKEHYSPNTPVVVVKRASWPDQEVVRGTLNDITGKVEKAGFTKTALIMVGAALGDAPITPSKLYHSDFSHEYRE
ncbi:MAG TPA: precorrin-4 C(11)-methyltransferase [Methanobacteriaceae archaeon]|nr:precorrin-4 C(11)-methyltransferase [Methanobacteriaceae archaeon]